MTTQIQTTICPPKAEISVNYIKTVSNKIHAVKPLSKRAKRLIKHLIFIANG